MKPKPLIGVIAPVLARSFMQDMLRGAIAQLRLCGCDALILASLIQFESAMPAHAEAERAVFRMIGAPDLDAFLYLKDEATMGRKAIDEIERRLLESQKYVMTVDETAHPVFDSTQYDDYDDFGKLTEHLIVVHGRKRIYCLTGPAESHQAQTRLRAWKDRMTQHGLYFDETYYEFGTFWYDSSIAYAKKLLSGQLPMPEAIVCGNDVMA
ncbi:MAG: substrate-binding domain-containing protein, partial [Oscillospiraceae bacterium]|nr:substrate-binding domain-containing protein [Oscillospiraceae bacterium]